MLKNKTEEFKKAMDTYNDNVFYNKFGILISTVVIILQAISLLNLMLRFKGEYIDISLVQSSLVLVLAYISTDFINGLVHMYMDNNTHYNSILGPFIAAFHMHHKHPIYKKRSPIMVYFMESGSKFWLVFYLMGVVYFNHTSLPLYLFLVSIGIFSSLAEVSHYWCHNVEQNNTFIKGLQRYRILLSKKHHINHHVKDNVNYAFLNGMTDPLLNIIAKYIYSGYKNNADQHVNAYRGKQTSNTKSSI